MLPPFFSSSWPRRLLVVSTVIAVGAAAVLVGRQGPPPAGGSVFGLLDSNGDQTLTGAELDAAPSVLGARDLDKDGRLSALELPQGGRGGRGGRGRGDEPGGQTTSDADDLADTLMAFDRNSDGQLTRDEVPERMQGIFDRVDTDKNGHVTRDEIRASAAADSQPTAEGRGERGGRGRGGEGRGGPGGPDRISAVLDPNADGVLDAQEIANAPKALRTLDRNGDGLLTPDEVTGGRGRGGRGGRGPFGGRGGPGGAAGEQEFPR